MYIQATNVICMLREACTHFKDGCKRGFVVGRLWATEGAHAQRAAQLPTLASVDEEKDHKEKDDLRLERSSGRSRHRRIPDPGPAMTACTDAADAC
jgi:hypothetical protein